MKVNWQANVGVVDDLYENKMKFNLFQSTIQSTTTSITSVGVTVVIVADVVVVASHVQLAILQRFYSFIDKCSVLNFYFFS